MDSKSAQTKYALYPWFIEHGTDLVHPDDLQRFRELMPYGKVFAVNEGNDEMVELSYGKVRFRVKPKLLQPVPDPSFFIGQVVFCGERKVVGEIVDVMWHHKESRPFFHVAIANKRQSKRYWDSDLVPATKPSNPQG